MWREYTISLLKGLKDCKWSGYYQQYYALQSGGSKCFYVANNDMARSIRKGLVFNFPWTTCNVSNVLFIQLNYYSLTCIVPKLRSVYFLTVLLWESLGEAQKTSLQERE